MYINKVKKTTRIDLCVKFYFIIALEYIHMYLKTTYIIRFRRIIYEIVLIENNKKNYHLNLNWILLSKCIGNNRLMWTIRAGSNVPTLS